MFEFTIQATDPHSRARTGEFSTHHGTLRTPQLAFVATEGAVKAIPPHLLLHTPIQYLIVNTFHIHTKGIGEKIDHLPNRIHEYANTPNDTIIASDSGGFQVFSLGFGKAHGVGKVAGMFPQERADPPISRTLNGNNTDQDNPLTISNAGVDFWFNNQSWTLTPEKSMEIQHTIGSDIIFAFDECTSPLNSKKYTTQALQRTHDWLQRCITYESTVPKGKNNSALFGIVQGGAYEDLRKKSARYFARQEVPGYGIGGSLGKSKQDMYNILDWVVPLLPPHKPRHLLGIGQVRDIFEGVARGVDLFDCVIPTREARHKVLYTSKGKFPLRKVKTWDEPLEIDLKRYKIEEKITYVDLYNLFLKKDPSAYLYATLQNIHFFANLMTRIQHSIHAGTFAQLKEEMYRYY